MGRLTLQQALAFLGVSTPAAGLLDAFLLARTFNEASATPPHFKHAMVFGTFANDPKP